MLTISFLAVSCGKTPDGGDIVGKWKCKVLYRTIEFRADGTVTQQTDQGSVEPRIEEGTYKLNGKQLEIQFKPDPRAIAGSKRAPVPEPPLQWKVSISGEKLVIVMGAGGEQTEAFTFQKVQ